MRDRSLDERLIQYRTFLDKSIANASRRIEYRMQRGARTWDKELTPLKTERQTLERAKEKLYEFYPELMP